MLTTIFLGLKFLLKPITEGKDTTESLETGKKKTLLAMFLGCGIGWVCGFTGTVSHVSMGAEIFPVPMLLTVISCVLGAFGAARFANRCEIRRLNKVVGVVLAILGGVTIAIKLI